MENTVLDNSGDDTSSVVDSVPVDTFTSEVMEVLEPGPETETETPALSMEVVSVDDLLERLTAAIEEEAADDEEVAVEEEVAAEEETSVEVEPDEVILEEDTGPSAVDTAVELLEVIQQQTASHPLLTTDFADYTVTEGLLLLALLMCFVSVCFKMLKEGFSWLN